jgi:hypothetical protein
MVKASSDTTGSTQSNAASGQQVSSPNTSQQQTTQQVSNSGTNVASQAASDIVNSGNFINTASSTTNNAAGAPVNGAIVAQSYAPGATSTATANAQDTSGQDSSKLAINLVLVILTVIAACGFVWWITNRLLTRKTKHEQEIEDGIERHHQNLNSDLKSYGYKIADLESGKPKPKPKKKLFGLITKRTNSTERLAPSPSMPDTPGADRVYQIFDHAWVSKPDEECVASQRHDSMTSSMPTLDSHAVEVIDNLWCTKVTPPSISSQTNLSDHHQSLDSNAFALLDKLWKKNSINRSAGPSIYSQQSHVQEWNVCQVPSIGSEIGHIGDTGESDAGTNPAASQSSLPRIDNLSEMYERQVVQEYIPQHGDEMALHLGDTVTPLRVYMDGWIYGRNQHGCEGMVPGNFLIRVQDSKDL